MTFLALCEGIMDPTKRTGTVPNQNKINTRSNISSSLNNLLEEKNNNKRSRDDLSLDASGQEIHSLDELWAKINLAISQSNTQIESKIETCMAKINGLEEKLAKFQGECSNNISSISAAVNEVRGELHSTNEWIGRFEKSSELIISAVPYVTNENLKATFEHITKALGFDTVPLVGLKRLTRNPIKPGDSPPIVCQFALRMERDVFYRQYLAHRQLNLSHVGFESSNRIYINENLTHFARNIRTEALKLRRHGQLQQVYTKDGVVFAKGSSATAAVACHSLAHLEHFRKPLPK